MIIAREGGAGPIKTLSPARAGRAGFRPISPYAAALRARCIYCDGQSWDGHFRGISLDSRGAGLIFDARWWPLVAVLAA